MACQARELLHSASKGNIKLLRQFRANFGGETFRIMCESAVDDQERNVIHYAALAGKKEMCKYLIQKVKVNVNAKTKEGDTPLLLAMKVDHIHLATYFLKHGADANNGTSDGSTALHLAASKGYTEFMKLLISRGAVIEANSNVGTPLQCAVTFVKKESVMVLLDHGANPNPTSSLRTTPLMLSLMVHSFDCLNLLVKAGADTNALSFGMTPLTLIASESGIEIVKYLLKAGANPNVVSATGMTPLEYAALARNNEVVMILLPVTSRIPTVPDWSLDGIISYFNSQEVNEERERKRRDAFQLLKQKGKAAFERKDYFNAMCCYGEAIILFPNDAEMLSNRSLCWARMNDGMEALSDAQACVKLRPDWPKAHYREGVAWTLLMDYASASHSFSEALKLDPKNEDIRKAFKEAELHKSREAELHKSREAEFQKSM